MKDSDRIVTLRTYASMQDAYVALSVLRDAGLIATVNNTLSTLYVPAPPPAGGYELMVFERDAPQAEKLLGD